MCTTKEVKNSFYTAEDVTSYPVLVQKFRKYNMRQWSWLFRGQEDNQWHLETSIERLFKRDPWFNRVNSSGMEYRLLREFKRRAHYYLSELPGHDNTIGWLSLMQHYGVPTRLLDWTFSFYVALHFAIIGMKLGGTCAIWAINQDWLLKNMNKMGDCGKEEKGDNKMDANKSVSKTSNKDINSLLGRQEKAVFPINPYRMNERLSIQQGKFIAMGNVDVSFEENLKNMSSEPDELRKNIYKFKIDGNKCLYSEAITELERMNINEGTLFPGLDGFSRGIVTRSISADIKKTSGLNVFTHFDKLDGIV